MSPVSFTIQYIGKSFAELFVLAWALSDSIPAVSSILQSQICLIYLIFDKVCYQRRQKVAGNITHGARQWAAVITWVSEMSAAPQNWPESPELGLI